MLVPGLLRHELELAMCRLGLIYDRTYAWDIFTNMMVGNIYMTFIETAECGLIMHTLSV